MQAVIIRVLFEQSSRSACSLVIISSELGGWVQMQSLIVYNYADSYDDRMRVRSVSGQLQYTCRLFPAARFEVRICIERALCTGPAFSRAALVWD